MSESETGKQTQADKPWLWKPGQSGNPSGRPKTVSLTAIMLRKLKEEHPDEPEKIRAEKVVEAALKQAESGNFQMFKEIWDRVDGKVADKLEVTRDEKTTAEKIQAIKAKVSKIEADALKN